MGNAAAKDFKEIELGIGNLDTNDSKCITSELVSDKKTVLKLKKKSWIIDDDESTVAFSTKSPSFFKPNTSVVSNAKGDLLAVTKTKNKMKTDTVSVYCPNPCYDGQEATPEIYKDPENKEKDIPMYLTVIIEKKGIFNVSAIAYFVTGADDSGEVTKEKVYTAEKIDSMVFYSLVKTPDGTPVAKLAQTKMTGGFQAEISAKVDIPLVMLLGFCCKGDGGNAGALAGAGVV